MTVNQTCYR